MSEHAAAEIAKKLKALADPGLLTSERRASWVYYTVVPAALRELSALLDLNSPA